MNRSILALVLVLTLAGIAAGRTDDHRDIRRNRAVPTVTATLTAAAPQATEPAPAVVQATAIPTCGVPVKTTATPSGLCVIESISISITDIPVRPTATP